MTQPGDPRRSVPRELAPLLRMEVPPVAVSIFEAIEESIPEYTPFRENVVDGIRQALVKFVDRIASPESEPDPHDDIHRKLGAWEFQSGRSLDSLQAAYRIGARIAWRHICAFAERRELTLRLMSVLGEAMIAHVDELVSLSVEGYAAAQASAAGTLERKRRKLLELLVGDPAAGRQAVLEAAGAAAWPMPDRLAAVALEPSAAPADDLPGDVLVDFEDTAPYLLVPNPVAVARWVRRALPGWRAAVGPPVPPEQARASLACARRVLALSRQGVLPDRPVLDCADHLVELTVLADEFLARQLAERALAPLAPLTERQRTKLAETLLVWLSARGGAPEVAARLQVHPQTVRYRVNQLDELFGDRMHDAEHRFALELALRAHYLLLRG
ncbi:PucR family transcriptional regulator [Lentzea jiangxiensis]|uniref:PucR C-terminal helix-turn-helix domain-containing protein n=1 Tax=Lentzea jiangxiensis TaxID=641025 RepID=A0A1H0UPS0_9PSEU|nr:helix-turn-helix domain-containing protein [Lentzea jiangxiensis]SDP67948.1 PucR C-terminal helix-turn-helix domain-containing protein [Lentzea jiangxiensis]